MNILITFEQVVCKYRLKSGKPSIREFRIPGRYFISVCFVMFLVSKDIVDSLVDKKWYEKYLGGLGHYGSTQSHGPFVHIDSRGYRARW